MEQKSQQEILYKKNYKHFRKILFERYGITLNFQDYVNLHSIKLSRVVLQADKRSFQGFIIINEMAVKVIKSRYGKGNPLVTVLHLKIKDLN